MSAQPPTAGPPAPPPPSAQGAIRCPRCSAEIGPEQDWCLECGAPARTRLAPTPNWQLPTVAIGAIVLVAGALLAFAFVKLTGDDATTAPTPNAPAVAPPPPASPPAVVPTATAPPATATAPSPSTPTATAPAQTTPQRGAAGGQRTTATTRTAPTQNGESRP